MPLGDGDKILNDIFQKRTGMSIDEHNARTRENAYQNNQINQNLKSWNDSAMGKDFMPFIPKGAPEADSVGNMLTQKYGPELAIRQSELIKKNEDEQVSNGLSSILSTSAGLNIMKEKGGILFGGYKPTYEFLNSLPESSPDKLKSTEPIQLAVDTFKKKLSAGDLSALTELKATFQTMKNDLSKEDLNKDSLDELTAAYQNIANYTTSRSTASNATNNVSSFFTLSPEEQSSILQDVAKNKKQLPFFLQGKDGSFEATQNKLLDVASFDITSPVYNETDLKTWKLLNFSSTGEAAAKNSAYYKKLGYSFDPTKEDYSSTALAQGYAGPAVEKFNAQKNLSYNFAVEEALKQQTSILGKKSVDLQTQIDKEVNQQTKDQLILQKASVEKNLTTANQLLTNLEPYTNADKYLKTFYPLAAEKQKAIDRAEVFAGTGFVKKGEESTFKESTFRSYQGLNKLYTSTMAGLHHRIGDHERGLSYDLAGQDLTPPSYRAGVDINNNGKFEQNELVLGKNGKPIYFNDAMYEGKDGQTKWNYWTAAEQTAPVAAQMAATMILSRGAGVSARFFNASYKNLGNAIGIESALVKAAPRISTFGNVFLTTFPSIYAEERKNYKNDADALGITTLRTGVEAFTETFIPQTELLKTGRSYGPLDPFFKKIADKLPFGLDALSRKADVLLSLYPSGTLTKTKAALLMLPARLRKVVSEGVQEGLVEEEGSLLGNYFVDKYASSKNFEITAANDLTLDNVISTGIGGFIPSLFVSGAVELYTKNGGKERLRQARWDLANNPATYKDFITKQVQANKITPEQGHERMALVDNLNNTLESMTEMGNIKDLTTLLDDKEAQKNYFHSVLENGDLLKIDRLALSPEQQKDYDALLARNADTIEKSKKNIEKYTNLTSPEKEQIVSNVFEERAKRLEDPNTSLSDVLTAADYARKQIAQFKKSDKNYDFVQSEYEKYHARAEATIADRVDNFQSLLENSPEQITNLELQLAQESFIPYLQRYNETKSEFVTPEAQPSAEGPSEANLIQKIEQELAKRQRLFEDDFNKQVPANLKNPETKDVQKRQLGLAELSAQELETGELAEGVHDHLDTATKLFLADALESHKEQKEQNPSQPTSIESAIDGIVKNEYELSTRGLTVEDALAKRISMNKEALGVNTTQAAPVNTTTSTETTPTPPVTTSSFAPTPVEPVKKSTANTGFVEPTADAQDILEYLGLDPENTLAINVVVFTQVSAENRQIDEIEEAEDRAPERVALFERVLTQSDPLDIYSGLLAMYPEQAKNIEQFFATYEDSPNTNLLPFLTKSQVEQLTEVLDEKLKPEEAPKENIEEQPAEQVIEEVPETTFEDEVVDGIIRDQELLSQVEQVPFTPRDLSLNIVSLNSANVPLTDDPRIAFAVNVVNAFDNQREKLPAVKLRIQGAMETYRYVLSSAKFEALKTLKNKPTLTSEDVEMLKSILSLNGVPFHENSFLQYLIDNPSKIGTGVLSVLTDEEGKVMLFEKNGVISAVGTPLISTFKANVLKGSLKTLVDQIKANPETVATANITGTVPGTSLVPIKLSVVKNKPNYSLRVFTEPTPDASGKYTLYPGRTYMVNSNNFFKSATAVSLPKADGELVYKLVEAFNNGTLPNGLPQSTVEFLNYLRTYQLTSFKSEKAVYVLDKNKSGDRIVFKKKNIAGKWQTASTITDKVKASIIESFNDAYKNILADKLNSNDRYYPTRLNANGEIELLPATTYRDHVMSPEFGATFNEEGNKTLGFDTPQINSPSSSLVAVSEVLENIPSQETPITESENTPTPVPTTPETVSNLDLKKADIKRRKEEALDSISGDYLGQTFLTYTATAEDVTGDFESFISDNESEIKNKIKAKYNEELSVLETPQETKVEEQPVRRRRSPKDLNKDISVDTSELKRSRLLENRINAKQKAKAKAWVASHPIFKNTSFIFDQTINHPEAYAVWSKSGIQLFSGANWAEAYHESWHEFTQLYLTPEQKQALYKEAAKIYGSLTPFELEEKMAEDFRSFALSDGKVFPEAIRKSKEAKGIFQSIWDFITNLFSNKKTVDFYFKQLYKGNIASYNRSEDNIRFKELFSRKLSVNADGELVTYSFVESDKIVKQFDALFTHVANQITKGVNGSFVNVAVSKEVIPKVYIGMRNIMSQTYNELLDLEEAGDTSVTPKLDYLDNLLENFDTVAQFHIQNSLIFDNKVKKGLQLDNIEEQQDTQGELGSFDQSVNEISQKELASNLIISAIRTLPKHTKGNINPEVDYLFGVPQLGDFDTNWNILRRTLAGLTTYEQMYAKLQELSKDYPQFTALINYLPQSIERFSALSFKNEFFNLFTMPYMEGYTTKITKDDNGGITVKVNKSSSLDAVRLKNLYDGEFGMTQGLYKVINPNTGLQDLDVDAYFTNNPSLPVGLDVITTDEERRARISQLINLIRPLGFNLSPEAVNSIPLEDMSLVERNVNLIRTKLRSLGENGTVGNPLNQLSSPHKVDKAVIKSENSAVNYFLNLEVKANPEYIDDMRMNAEGSRVWSVNQHTFMSRVASALNDYETYPTAKDVYKAFPQLDPEYNSNTIGSFVLDYLFDKDGNRITDSYNGGKAVYRQVELANLEGIKIEEEGEKTINTNYIDKHFAEVNSFLQQGVEEINRLSGKSTTRAFVLDLGLRKFLGMDKEWSKDGQGNIRLFDSQMRLLFKAIMAEIKMTKEIEDKVANGQKVYTRDGKPKKGNKEKEEKENLKLNFIRDKEGNPKLGYFEDILSTEQRRKLYEIFDDTQVIQNGDNILNELFEKATSEFPIIAEIAQNFNVYFNSQAEVSLAYFKSRNLDTVEPVDLFKYHFFSFLNRLEQHKLFYGHPYYYKSAKDIEKRLSAWNAFGSYTMLDPANTKFLQDKVFTQRGTFINYAEANNIPVNEQINDLSKVNYIVLKDNPVVSKTALANKEAYGESLDAYINEGSEKDKSKTQDAAAFMTLDFFKRFYALSTGITPEMDQEIGRQNRIYQAILDNDQATLRKELNTKASYKFTIKKLQYAGFAKGVNNEGVPVFHKYSVKPILPSEAVNSPELLAILHKLHASSADYAVFESGTKIAETVTPVSLYKKGKVDTTNVPIGQIDIKHLKEQVLIENKESFESVFSTQFRSLLYKDAEDAEVLKLYEAYKSYVKEIVEYDKLNYLENLNDKDKLVNFLLKELEKKNASEATKDLIKVKNDGTLMYMLDSMVDRTVMESAIVSSAKRKIIRQKLNGAQRVQYPVSVVRPGRTLNYYSLTKDGKEIVQAEVIVSFSKGYYPLLNLMYEGSPIGELNSNGEPISPFDALTRLNEALQNPAFVKANKKALSMVAIRIPGQGYNSMENFTVVEFLPEESGEIILVPDEMVVKSGSDYDIDKLFCYDPYIAQDGSVPLTTQTAKDSFGRKKKLTEDYKILSSTIEQTREFKNSLIAQLEEILTKYGVDKNKKLKEVYLELKELRSQLSTEVDEEELSVEALQNLKDYFSKEVTVKESEEQKKVAEEVKKIREQVKALQEVLKEASETTISRDFYLVSEVFKKLYADKNAVKNELDGLRKTLANNLIFNVVDRLSQPDIFSSLITPNSSDIIKSLAAEFGEVRDNTTATYTSILSPIYQMYVFNLNTYKKSLGVGAKVNTFHSLVQKAKLNLENQSANRFYILPSNKVDDKVYYSGIYDTNGDIISLLNGQMISAHVDIEKEDEVARIYFNNVITPVVLYTAIAGTPVKDITRLINQTYKNQPEDEKSQRSSIVRYGLGTSAQDILEEMQKNPEIAKFIKSGTRGINVKKTVGHALNLLTSKASKEAVTEFMLTQQTPLADFYRFMQFMEFEAQQKQLSTLSLNTDYHTFSPQNFESFRRGAEDLRQLRKENYFNRSAVDYMISETEISPFQIQADILDKFVEVMPISANRKLTDIILTMHASLTKKGSKVDYEKFSRTFKNDLLYALFVNRVPEAQEYEQYLVKTNENNIVNMRNSLVSRLEKRGIESDNVIFDMFKQNTNNESAYIRTGLLLSSVDYSINVYKEAFENGLSWTSPELNPESQEDAQLIEDMQKFFKVFAYAGILGTQLNKKIDSYLPLIPESIYTYSMSQVVNEFKNELDVVSANLLEEVRNTLSAKSSVTEEEDNIEDELTTKLLSNTSFLGQFINRFQEVHPEFNKIFKDVNPDLAFFKDYRLDQENSTPTKKKVVEENVPNVTTNLVDYSLIDIALGTIENTISTTNLKEGDYEILSIDGIPTLVSLQTMPPNPSKTYKVFYSSMANGMGLYKRVGKEVVVLGFEDIKLMIDQVDKSVFELSTGLSINTTTKSLKDKLVELKALFEEKDIRSVIARSQKIAANEESAIISTFKARTSNSTTETVSDIVADPFKSVEEINREQENNCILPKN